MRAPPPSTRPRCGWVGSEWVVGQWVAAAAMMRVSSQAQWQRAACGGCMQRLTCCAPPLLIPFLQGEEATARLFESDPYGCGNELRSKRMQRDPFAAGGYNGDRCVALPTLGLPRGGVRRLSARRDTFRCTALAQCQPPPNCNGPLWLTPALACHPHLPLLCALLRQMPGNSGAADILRARRVPRRPAMGRHRVTSTSCVVYYSHYCCSSAIHSQFVERLIVLNLKVKRSHHVPSMQTCQQLGRLGVAAAVPCCSQA